MSKIFEFDARKGSYIDQVSGAVGVNTNGSFVRGDKGNAWKGNGNNSKIQWAIPFDLNQDWTYSAWVKVNDYSNGSWDGILLVGTSGSNYTTGIGMLVTRMLGYDTVTIQSRNYTAGALAGAKYVLAQYIHTVANKTISIYFNGIYNVLDTYTGLMLSTPTHITVGFQANGTGYLDGEIGLAQIYDHALTSSERAKLYKEFLKAQPTTTDISQNLDLPAKVSDRSRDVDSVIGVKGANKTTFLDSGKGSFETDTENWAVFGTNTISKVTEDGVSALKITYVDNIGGAFTEFKASGDIDRNLDLGKKYIVRVRAKVTGGVAQMNIAGFGISVSSRDLTSTFQWVDIVFTPTSTTGNYIRTINMGAGEIVYIDQWEISEWDGEELVPDDTVGFVANDVSKWAVYGTNTKAQDGNAVKITYVDNPSGAFIYLRNTTSGATWSNPVTGDKYNITIRAKVNSGSNVPIYVADGGGSEVLIGTVSDTEYKTFSMEYTVAGANVILRPTNSMGAGEIVWCEILSVKKVTGLVASYNMIPNEGVLVDTSGEGANGTMLGSITSTNKGLKLSNVDNGYIDLATFDYSILDIDKEFTIVGRIKSPSDITRLQSVFASAYLAKMVTLNILTPSGLVFGWYFGGYTTKSIVIQANTEYDFVGIIRNRVVTLYVNGVEATTTGASGNASSVSKTYIGSRTDGDNVTKSDAEYIDLQIHNRAWTEQEAIDYHNSFEVTQIDKTIEDLNVGDTI